MNVLVINSGSSSIKYQLFSMPEAKVLAKGLLEKIGEETSALKHTAVEKNKEKKLEQKVENHKDGMALIFSLLTDKDVGVISDMKEISGVGHRVVHGGEAFNKSSILTDEANEAELLAFVKEYEADLKNEYHISDADVSVLCTKKKHTTDETLDRTSFVKVLFMLRNLPCGVQHMSMDIPGLVETSLNAGIMTLSKDTFALSFSVRSSVTSRKYEVTDRLTFVTEFLGGSVNISGDYPAWEYKAESKMRDLMVETYRDLFRKEPQIQAIHAGLECGIFSGKIEGLDCISFGPANFDIHTPKERLSISSTERVWNLIVEFLKRSK